MNQLTDLKTNFLKNRGGQSFRQAREKMFTNFGEDI